MMCASGQLPPRSHLLVHKYWMQMRPPGSMLAPYGAGAAELIVGLSPSAGAAGLLPGAFGSTSKPSAAAAAMPFCAMVGCSAGLAGTGGGGNAMSGEGRALSPEFAPGAGSARRPPAAGSAGAGAGGFTAAGGTMIVRLGLLERLLLRLRLLLLFLCPGLRLLLLLRFGLRPLALEDRLLALELEDLLLRFFFGFFFFCVLPCADSAMDVALWTLAPRCWS
mmetsp:Transcript_133167/g.323735  ORF Transcript_133167/g.323735 Transcript_133167/m.323735 type:complete len:221 (+) Transcript_133167:202-864(+)